jgi:hypothetical protein
VAVERAVFLIADIGGYTRFMKVHRINLAHAQYVVAQLLEALIDAAAPRFKLAKLEGDAAFFYALANKGDADLASLGEQIVAIRRAFVRRRRQLEIDRLCSCDGCVQASQLTLKFVSHVGDVAFQKVKRLTELAGVDVIFVHRLLKNAVPITEYVLMSEPVHAGLAPAVQQVARESSEELEGLGAMRTYYVDLNDIAAEPEPDTRPSWGPRKLFAWAKMSLKSLPYLVGRREACEGFRNMEAANGALVPMKVGAPTPRAGAGTS